MTLTTAQEAALKKIYYKGGKPYGRDRLYFELKERMPINFPVKHEINIWLKKQRVHQLQIIPDKPKTVTGFRTIKPLHSFSIDLIDYSNKAVNGHHYVVNMIDNFSRFMWTRPIKHKTPEDVVDAIRPIFESIKKKYDYYPKYILSDGGGEFKAAYSTFLEELKIRRHRTIGGTP
jgi:hypothetical protein